MGPHEYEQVETEFPAAKYLLANWQEILFKSLLMLSVTSELPVGAVVHFLYPESTEGSGTMPLALLDLLAISLT